VQQQTLPNIIHLKEGHLHLLTPNTCTLRRPDPPAKADNAWPNEDKGERKAAHVDPVRRADGAEADKGKEQSQGLLDVSNPTSILTARSPHSRAAVVACINLSLIQLHSL